MFKKNVFKILTILTICIFCISLTGEAGWLDSWYQEAISSSPEYVKGQQRGYFTFGSFSARTNLETLHPISVSMPRLKVGCGGIDIFWGGVSFLGFDYLVKKLQMMIQAAPYVAFQIALKTISQKLGGIIEAAEQMAEKLNSLQFNECQFLNGFMVKLFDTGDITAALQEGAVQSGLVKDWKISMEQTKPNKGPEGMTSFNLIGDCPPDVRDALSTFADEGLLFNIAMKRHFYDTEVIGLIRAAVGDMYLKFDTNSSAPQIVYVPPCGDFFSEMESKKIVRIRESWNDECKPYKLNEFFSKIRQDLYNLYNQMKNRGNTLNYQGFLNPRRTPLPVYLIIKTAIMTKDPSLIESIVEPVGYGYLRNAMAELISYAYADVQKAFELITNAEKVTPGSQTGSEDKRNTCHMPELPQKYVETLLENHAKAMQSMNYAFISTLSQVESLINVVNKFQNFYEIASKQLALKFGVFPTNKVLGGI